MADLMSEIAANRSLPPRQIFSGLPYQGEISARRYRDVSEMLPGLLGAALERAGVPGRTAMDYGHRVGGYLSNASPLAPGIVAADIGARVGDQYATNGIGAAAKEAAAYGIPSAAMIGLGRAFLPGNRDAGLAEFYNNMPGKSITGFSRGNPADGSILDRSFYLSTEPGMVNARKQAERYGKFRSPYRDDPGIPLFHDNEQFGFTPRVVK